ncbi:hypothetical protein AUJ29_03450 [Candidatus Kuenenbacteria bacterium CG1_02_38_13]|uniref:SpoVT-AbrB domain-containing protein n=1 Tax=Candidatus Kuenenbacteria bacterium CG1_02_38_13 TaxID=1805235 RepID=A0A1J4TV59_9BACT|nr:MAG: hypothetical protein AUJ29_03450 [Candidatus Kuenenbacteria bacterium CG1_02_38_13]
MNQLLTIRDRRQITFPRDVLEAFGLGVGDKLFLQNDGNKITLAPVKSKSLDLLSEIKKIVNNSKITEKDLQESARQYRKDIVKQKYS